MGVVTQEYQYPDSSLQSGIGIKAFILYFLCGMQSMSIGCLTISKSLQLQGVGMV